MMNLDSPIPVPEIFSLVWKRNLRPARRNLASFGSMLVVLSGVVLSGVVVKRRKRKKTKMKMKTMKERDQKKSSSS